jgi:hypothetical protein
MRSQESRAVSLPPLLEGNGFVRNSDLYGTGVIPTSRALWDSEPESAARAPTTGRHAPDNCPDNGDGHRVSTPLPGVRPCPAYLRRRRRLMRSTRPRLALGDPGSFPCRSGP